MLGTAPAFSGFAVDDVPAAKAFYADVLGLRVTEEHGMLTLHLAGGRDTLVYPKDQYTPATYTILNLPVADISSAVEALAARGVRFRSGEHIDPDGIFRGEGPLIAWFTDPAGNVLSVLEDPTLDQPVPTARADRSGPILGAWRTTGEVLAEDGETVAATISGTDAYERLGEHLVVHHVDVTMGEDRSRGLEVIGPYDEGHGAFRTTAYDAATGAVEHSTADVDDAGVMTFRSGTGAARAEASLRVDDDGQRMRGAWSRTEDDGATWRPWLRLAFTRLPATTSGGREG